MKVGEGKVGIVRGNYGRGSEGSEVRRIKGSSEKLWGESRGNEGRQPGESAGKLWEGKYRK